MPRHLSSTLGFHPGATIAWLAAFASLAACAGFAPQPSHPREPTAAPEVTPEVVSDLVTLTASWVDGDPPAVDVAIEAHLGFVDPAPTAVTFYFAPVEFVDGDHSGVRFLSSDAHGELDREAGSVTWPVVDGVARGRYRVVLEHSRHQPLRGIDNVPHATAGGWTVPGAALFPIDDGRSVDGWATLRFALPEGWEHHHSADVAGTDAPRIDHFCDFAQSVHTLGDYALTSFERGAGVVRLLSADYTPSALGGLRALVERTLDEGSLRATEMPGLIVVHEMMHLWARGDALWLNEGLARMLEIGVGVILDDLDPQAATAELRRRLERYSAQAVGRRVLGDEGGSWPYEGGLAVLLCVDSELRAAGSSLLHVHRGVREQEGLPVRVEAFRDALEHEVEGLGARLDAWLEHNGGIPLAPCLNGLGFEASPREVSVPGIRALVVGFLGARGFDTDRMRIESVGDESTLRAGDVVLRVAGESVRSLGAMAWALQSAREGDSVPVEILRDAESITRMLPMPRLAPEDRETIPALLLRPGRSSGRLFR